MLVRRATDYFLFGLLILIPFISLVQFDETIYPYVTSKYFTFRFVVQLALGLWVGRCLIERRVRPKNSFLLKTMLLFLGVVFIADVFGANFWNSFWSNYSRMEGFLSLVFLLFFFLILSSVLDSVKKWQWYWLSHIFVSIVILVIAVLQKMHLMLAVDYNRVDSVFGNASYLAIYASMIFFLCLYVFLSSGSKWMKGFMVVAGICNLTSIYLSQTRSATLAVLVCLGFFFYFLARNKWKAMAYMFSALLAFVLGVFLFKSKTGVSTNLFERIANVSLKDGSTQARVEIWAYCWRAFLDSPIVGWGQESFSYLSIFYRPQLWSTPWVDRSHNIFLEWMVNAGSLGLIALCLFLGAIFYTLIKLDETKISKPQKLALLSLLVCWLINECLSIDFFSISILFYSIVAFIHFLHVNNKSEPEVPFKNMKDRETAAIIVFIFIGLMANFKINISQLQKNIEMRQFSKTENILQSDRNKTCRADIGKMKEGLLSFEAREFRSYLIQNAHIILSQFRQKNASDECVRAYYEAADYMIQREIVDDPKDYFFKHVAANFYTQFFNFPDAHTLFKELIEKTPQQQNYWIDLGHWYLAQGKLTDGLQMYQKAYDLEHGNPTAIMYLAMGLVYNKRFAEGNAYTNRLMEMERAEAFDERLINAYSATDQKQKIEELMAYKKKFYSGE